MHLKFNHFENHQAEKITKICFYGTGHIRINESTIIFLWGFHNTLILRVV